MPVYMLVGEIETGTEREREGDYLLAKVMLVKTDQVFTLFQH